MIFGGSYPNVTFRMCHHCKDAILADLRASNLIILNTNKFHILLCCRNFSVQCVCSLSSTVVTFGVRCYGRVPFKSVKPGYSSYEDELGPIITLRIYNDSRRSLL
jgi:hypothetical protein